MDEKGETEKATEFAVTQLIKLMCNKPEET